MAPKPPSSDDQNPAPADDPELAKKLAVGAAAPPAGGKATAVPPDGDKDD
jgi:ATP-binding cassette subfamily B protein